jgi:hypothetical protein
MDPIGDNGEVNAEGNFGVIGEEMHGVQSPGARHHQGGRAKHSILKRTEDGRINRMTHPEIIGIDNQ